MNAIPAAEQHQSLEKFRQLLFHLQMQCGSIHDIFRFFKEQESMQHFEALKSIDPNLMSQLLAREYVLEARKCPNAEHARSHLHTALQLDPKCPEAFLELATISDTAEGAMKWYSKCMEFTANALGEQRFQELLSDFKQRPWHQVELHTYLKAKVSLAEKLFREGYYEVANLHLKDMLEWNPTDDIQVRYFYMVSLLCENQLKAAQALKLSFSNDLSAQWYYCRAFLQFKLEGDSRRSNRLLMRAFKRNLWVAIYSLGLQEMPKVTAHNRPRPLTKFTGLPLEELAREPSATAYREGGKEEAVDCVRYIAPAVLEDAKLAAWVWDLLKGLV
ncbi:MAG: hypothetical protein AAFZ15_00825 [Bacteroidota bacterium]